MDQNRPIGIFDSGVGGLSVLQKIRNCLPNEALLYVADSGYAPYGDRSVAFITSRSFIITKFLLEHDVKAIVVACNTATAVAITLLRKRFDLPIIGIEPALKPAVTITRSGAIGILATGSTVRSNKFTALLNHYKHLALIIVQPCPGLAECVENGELNSPHVIALLEAFIRPLLAYGVDTIVLGCTHYPFLMPLIRQLTGPKVLILDSSDAVALYLRSRLTSAGLLASNTNIGMERYFTSGALEKVASLIGRLLGNQLTVEYLPF